jgi:hypothetical protein
LALSAAPALSQTSPYPPTDRPWAAADYAALAEAVSSGKAPLPTLADPATRPVFERLVSEHDVGMDMEARHQGTAEARLQEIVQTMAAFQPLLTAYLTAAQNGKPVERELAKLISTAVFHAASADQVADEILPTLPHDAAYQARMNGLEQMRNGTRTILLGVAGALGEPGSFSKASQLEMIAAVKSRLPAFQSAITDAFRTELAAKLGESAGKNTDPEVKAALLDLQKAVAQH